MLPGIHSPTVLATAHSSVSSGLNTIFPRTRRVKMSTHLILSLTLQRRRQVVRSPVRFASYAMKAHAKRCTLDHIEDSVRARPRTKTASIMVWERTRYRNVADGWGQECALERIAVCGSTYAGRCGSAASVKQIEHHRRVFEDFKIQNQLLNDMKVEFQEGPMSRLHRCEVEENQLAAPRTVQEEDISVFVRLFEMRVCLFCRTFPVIWTVSPGSASTMQ